MALGMAPEMEMSWKKNSALIVGFFPQQHAMEFCVFHWSGSTVRSVRRQHPVLSTRWVWTTAVKVFQCQVIIRFHHLRWCAITDGWPEAGGVFWEKRVVMVPGTVLFSYIAYSGNQQGSSAASSAKWVILVILLVVWKKKGSFKRPNCRPKTTTDT